ncbi:MAG: SUMF1/EgtB/PvdO family nonheme iron enzyme [Anaerolineae bacterium]|nr:SUMF1/EgtB/PvdO family nonheme iron enzyme [Anaerolineae bacterium]
MPDFRIGKYPVTNRQYAAFIRRAKAQDMPKDAGWFLREPPADRLDHPVTGVSWGDAVAYGRWLSSQTGRHYRLPTEAEWEKAARGTDGRLYPWGPNWDPTGCNAASAATTPVTAHPAGASPYRCEDMLGNVQEWTSTAWGSGRDAPDYPYPYRADDGREETDAGHAGQALLRLQRGGSYRSQGETLRSTARGISAPDSKVPWRGFRVAMTI